MGVGVGQAGARGISTRLASVLVVGAVVGTLEWLSTASWAGDWGGALRGWLALTSTWAWVAGMYALVESVVLWAAFGVAGSDWAGRTVAVKVRSLWRRRHDPEEHARVASLLAYCGALSLWAAGSMALLAHLIEHRHGAWLIAITALAGQLAWALVCGLVARVAARGLTWLLSRLRIRWLHLPAVLMLGAALGLSLAVLLTARFWEVVVATDAPALLWPLLLIAGSWVSVHLWSPARAAVHRAAWAVWASCLFILPLALDSGGARAYALRQSHTSKYLIKGLMNASDVDGDGSASYPIRTDCAPFDGHRHPMAVERPGNGVDENCDGIDELALFASHAHEDFEMPPGPRPNLVLVTIDATRADHLGFMGYERNTSPHLDAFAKRSVVFTRAFSQDSGTAPSFWSMHTGKTPFQVKLLDPSRFPPRLSPTERTLAQHLRKAGYHTEGVMCGSMFDSPRFDVRRGFSRYRNVCRGHESELAKLTADAALRAIERLRRPFFLWVHFFDPHGPYEPVEQFDFGRDEIARYDSEIRYADEHLGRLLKAIEQRAEERPAYVAFTADHGENFGEHGHDPHARNLYRVVTHVPFLLHGPGVVPDRVDTPVAANDIFPTFLQLARVPESASTTMVSQVPVAFGESPDPTRIVFQENSYSRPRRDTKGAVRGDYHFILDLTTGVEELYHYVEDPAERRNLIGAGLPDEALLRAALLQFVSTTHVPKNLSK